MIFLDSSPCGYHPESSWLIPDDLDMQVLKRFPEGDLMTCQRPIMRLVMHFNSHRSSDKELTSLECVQTFWGMFLEAT